ncbi:MAG: hypothetical protein HYX34_04760 [Actinobacteria bacterium]|nr:hypothetical protein [Actinomycetota bacterium]
MPTATAGDELRKGERVVAARDMRGVPEGTRGKVAIVNGLTWIRYWVRFDNGVSVGSLNRKDLKTPDEWERRNDVAVPAAGAAADGDGAGGGVTVNGVLVPQRLIERTRAARARVGK